ncbi:MAG: type II toxin-antitoxin system RelE/ParE family toxin [Selenomonadaceae bacterium]|nr:type II toxin-antitoxin system RelE/ParE family toxin [Selenomonadaceae bacterium]
MSANRYDVLLYEKPNGACPVQEFLDSLDNKMAAKMYGMIEFLEENSPALRMPYSEHFQDGIFELRAKVSNNITRVLYFFYVDKKIILPNGFVKKTQKTPKNELRTAIKYRQEFWERDE